VTPMISGSCAFARFLFARSTAPASTRARTLLRSRAVPARVGKTRSRATGSTQGYVLNGHVGPAEVQAVLGEFLLESGAWSTSSPPGSRPRPR
jgi:hypothetical protein